MDDSEKRLERCDKLRLIAPGKSFERALLSSFSSGMYVRLAFATAIQTDPDSHAGVPIQWAQ